MPAPDSSTEAPPATPEASTQDAGHSPVHRQGPSRRAVLGAGIPVAALMAMSAQPAAAGPPRPRPMDPGPKENQDEALAMSVAEDGVVTVSLHDGTALVKLSGYRIAVGIDARAATVEKDEEDGDAHVVEISYATTDPAYTAQVIYRAEGPVLTADWEFTGPADADFTDGRIYRSLHGSDVPEWSPVPREYPFTLSHWEEDRRGGVPYRVPDSVAYFASWKSESTHAAFVIPDSQASRAGDGSLHAPPTQEEDGTWKASYGFRADGRVAESREAFHKRAQILGSALLTGPELAVDLSHPSTYRLFEEAGKQTFEVSLFSREERRASVTLTARVLDGDVVTRWHDSVKLDASTATTIEVDVDLPGPRSYVYLEVTARAGGDRALIWSGAGVVPPHEFGPSEQSIIGMGGFSTNRAPGASQLPGLESREEEIALWQRMGVRHIRNNWLSPEESDDLDIATAFQPAAQPEQFAGNPDGFQRWLDRAFELGEGTGAQHYELANEWNLQGGGIGIGFWAKEYTENYLLPFREEMDKRGIQAKLNSMGLGSWDPVFVDGIRKHGGWDALDGVAIHPGRGNFAADYDPVDVEDIDPNGEVWNFYGATRRAKAYLDEFGPDKELWITELYAMSSPNRWWNDDERTAVDSAFLTLMLSKAIGVTGVHWFQLYDGIWNDKYGVNPTDPEFHYGLLRADRSPKATLLSFMHAAELLDGAEFQGFIESEHPDLHGLRFTDDEGPFWVLWSRQDGFIHNPDHEEVEDPENPEEDLYYPFKDPWERHTRRKLTVRVPESKGVRALDVLGAEVRTHSVGRSRTFKVTASPVVVRGIDPDATGPEKVKGARSLNLTDLEVKRVEGGVEISGRSGLGRDAVLHVETSPARPQVVEVEQGSFTIQVDGDLPEGTQVRVFSERRRGGQVHRAEFYRTV
ncbi:hypothetical protein ACT3TE_11065 [Brachybacterium sp. AOP42-B2-9]|uniref:hypothetical protein n=1 Tax=Brachybacterium sp. AOP42-B2-9 TaxID=3457672 RepID=UPI00403479C6